MVDITIVNGVYKPTYNWGAPHCSNGTSAFLDDLKPVIFTSVSRDCPLPRLMTPESISAKWSQKVE